MASILRRVSDRRLTPVVLTSQLEHELLILLPLWEQEHSRAFMVNGERVLELIQARIDAKEAEKEARKVS